MVIGYKWSSRSSAFKYKKELICEIISKLLSNQLCGEISRRFVLSITICLRSLRGVDEGQNVKLRINQLLNSLNVKTKRWKRVAKKNNNYKFTAQ